ncbi:hypothetical protein [Thermococcus gammatolerans]|nr:hypothetical protein [Thermococcus gammatolerans]
MWVTLKGKHLTVKIDVSRYVSSPHPFFLIFTVDEHLLLGACWKGKIDGANANIHGFLQELLIACIQILNPKESTSNFARKEAMWMGFALKEGNPAYEIITSSNPSSIYYLEAEGSTLKIHYYNDFLSYTDCPEFKGKHRGVVEVPLKEFIEDVLKISREYLEKYASVIEKIRLEHGEELDDYDFLWGLYREVKDLYEKKFRPENR